MTGHAKKLSDLEIVIPNRLGINRILQSLPPSYKNFVMNYNMQNMNKELPELFSMLKAAEIEIKKEHQVLMVNKTTSFKKQGKSKGKFKKGGKKAAAPPVKPKTGPKPDAECYYCKKKGHRKRNCSKYLADLKSGLVKKKKEVDRGEYAYTWADFKKFLRGGFGLPYMEKHKQSSGVGHALKEVNKCLAEVMQAVDKCIVPIKKVVPLPTVTEDKVISSEERKPGSDTKSATVTVEEDVPLSGLNMQLKRVQDDACKTVDKVDDYVDEIEYDVLPLEVCGLHPWQYDRNVTHVGRANTYSFMHGGKQRTLKPLGDDHIKSDVELVVRKEKLHQPKVQLEVHDIPSIYVGDVSAKPVDDKPVLVGDKPDVATLVVDVDVAACATVPVCVHASIHTIDICADDTSVHVAQMRVGGVGGERVIGDGGQRHYHARNTVQFSATPRMHRGKDGRVRHLCGPGITHLVQGHVQRNKVPSKPRKKKELAPKSKLMWRRKDAPSVVSSREGREGGCGVEGKQDLKTARTCHVHITSPFSRRPSRVGDNAS
ncbi:hypothetical protein QYE76_029274 [Lolium multiflorum]|uniref:CCHC-type domain-containing protein n=1 Tax=Lolium multiflorum TaxID=4521 RepID=A0AAD8VHQ0_LOLMU|nr:hypothetical protein QYE76_029274 [Lolium multiflorum]